MYDPKKEAAELSKVLHYNQDMVANKVNDLALVLELRLEAAFEAGRAATRASKVPVTDISHFSDLLVPQGKVTAN